MSKIRNRTKASPRPRSARPASGIAQTETSMPATSSMMIGFASRPSVFSASPLAQTPSTQVTRIAMPTPIGVRLEARGRRTRATANEPQVAPATGRNPTPNPVASQTAARRILAERLQDELAGQLEGVEDPGSAKGDGFVEGGALRV